MYTSLLRYLKHFSKKKDPVKLVIFIGSNPSVASPFTIFQGTRSMAILDKWIDFLRAGHDEQEFNYSMINVYDKPTKNNRPLKRGEVVNALPALKSNLDFLTKGRPFKVVALGRSAEWALGLIGVPHYPLPHPSPRNRALNNKKELNSKLDQCKEWLWRKTPYQK